MTDLPRQALRRNDKLIRHAAIRRLLWGRTHQRGVRTTEQLREELLTIAGIRVSMSTLTADLREIGAFKVSDRGYPEAGEWWQVPAYNPNVEDIRSELDPAVVESEVGYKLMAHVIDVMPVGRMVYLLTEARAGLLISYWLSWLAWPEILIVQGDLDSAVVHCVSGIAATNVAERLVGYTPRAMEPDEDGGDDGEATDDLGGDGNGDEGDDEDSGDA